MDKSIDFDPVADLYDVLVQVDFDIDFWKEEAAGSASVLELMCGTGRIGYPLVETGVSYTGIDYSRKLLERFETRLVDRRNATLVFDDARYFELSKRFDLIFK